MTSDLFKEYAKNPTIELRNQLIAEGRYTDAVDDLLLVLCK